MYEYSSIINTQDRNAKTCGGVIKYKRITRTIKREELGKTVIRHFSFFGALNRSAAKAKQKLLNAILIINAKIYMKCKLMYHTILSMSN